MGHGLVDLDMDMAIRKATRTEAPGPRLGHGKLDISLESGNRQS